MKSFLSSLSGFFLFFTATLLGATGVREFIPQPEPDGWGAYEKVNPEESRPTSQDLFSLAEVPEVLLTFSPAEYKALLEAFDFLPTNETVVHGSFTFASQGEKTTLEDVGIRIRGNTFSRLRPENDKHHTPGATLWQRPHFRVIFDKYQPKQNFYGLKSLNLKMYNVDSTYLRENYAMDLFERFGVTTYTRIIHTRVSLYVQGDPKPAYLGVYRILETIDKDFVKDRFADKGKGFLWKCLWPTPLNEKNSIKKMGIEDPNNGKSYPYDLKTKKGKLPEAQAQLETFINNLNTLKGSDFEAWAEKFIDIPQLLKAMAVSNALGVMDDYWANQNNYYLYFDQGGRVTYIPYDFDNILGTANGEDPILMDPFDANNTKDSRPLIERFLNIPKYRAQYASYLRELIDPARGLLDWGSSRQRLTAWKDEIQGFIPNAQNPGEEWIDAPADWGKYPDIRLLSDTNPSKGVRNFFQERVKVIQKALEKEGF